MSEVEILSSFAHDFCTTAQHFVCTSESSIQKSEQSVFVLSMQLPRSTIKNPFTTGSSTESSVACSFWTKVQRECVHCSSCVQDHFHPFKTLLRHFCHFYTLPVDAHDLETGLPHLLSCTTSSPILIEGGKVVGGTWWWMSLTHSCTLCAHSPLHY